jgi:hypothetical protein
MASNQNWKGRHTKNTNLKNMKIYNKLKKEKPTPNVLIVFLINNK